MKIVFTFIASLLLFSTLIAQNISPVSVHHEQSEFYSGLSHLSETEFDSVMQIKPFTFHKVDTNCALEKMVFGYHPYWIGSAYQSYHWNLLSDLCYFSCEVDPVTGNPTNTHNFLTTPVIDTALAHGTTIHLCVTMFSGHNSFLNNQEAQQNLINQLISLLIARNAIGVNIDFEAIPYNLELELTNFMIDLSYQIHDAIPESIVSMATPAVDWNGIFNIEVLNEHIDFFMIMGYDYYWNGSSMAGPVDGMYSMVQGYNYNVSRTLSWYLSNGASPEKTLLGLPYYGREWETVSGQAPSNVTGWGQAKTYYSIHNSSSGNYIDENKFFETNSFSPYYAFFTDGWNQCFIDDVYSLGKRYDLINLRNIAGLGIWALGYDYGYQELWQLIQDKFSNCKILLPTDTIYDSGGPAFNHYNNEDYWFTITSEPGTNLLLTFLSFELESGYDNLSIYDGPGPDYQLIDIFTGYDIPDPIMASGNALTFHFISDDGNVFQGWEAVWETLTVSTREFENQNDFSLSVFPNPATGLVNIRIEGMEKIGGSDDSYDTEILMYDMHGNVIQRLSNELNSSLDLEVEIDLSDTKSGIYFVQMKIGGKFSDSKKLILMAD